MMTEITGAWKYETKSDDARRIEAYISMFTSTHYNTYEQHTHDEEDGLRGRV